GSAVETTNAGSSSSSTGTTPAATTPESAASSSPSTTSGGSGGAPTGAPIKLSVMATNDGITGVPQLFNGAEAAVASINAAGGIKDASGGAAHPLELGEGKAT